MSIEQSTLENPPVPEGFISFKKGAYLKQIVETLPPDQRDDRAELIRRHCKNIFDSFLPVKNQEKEVVISISDFCEMSNSVGQAMSTFSRQFGAPAMYFLHQPAAICAEMAFDLAAPGSPERKKYAANFIRWAANTLNTGNPYAQDWNNQKAQKVTQALEEIKTGPQHPDSSVQDNIILAEDDSSWFKKPDNKL